MEKPASKSSVTDVFNMLWTAILGLANLLWNLATEGLKMILNTLREIPPIVLGLISATLLFWFGLTILTSNETVLIIFAIAVSLLALGALGLSFFQKWLDYKMEMKMKEWEYKEGQEASRAAKENQ